jgi:hypothetical protein
MNRRASVRVIAFVLAAVCLAAAPAAAFPDKPVELTVLFGAGSAADLLARRLAELAGKDLGQPVAVVNRTGAGGALGYAHVKSQSPDGYALVWNSNSVSTAYHAGNMKFDYTAFAGVAALTSEPVSLAVKVDAPWKDLRELIAHAKAHPGQVRIGNSGRSALPPDTRASSIAMAGSTSSRCSNGPAPVGRCPPSRARVGGRPRSRACRRPSTTLWWRRATRIRATPSRPRATSGRRSIGEHTSSRPAREPALVTRSSCSLWPGSVASNSAWSPRSCRAHPCSGRSVKGWPGLVCSPCGGS